jgi:hypothetical protein
MTSLTNSVNTLIGLDKTATVNAYYERDERMNVNAPNTIINALKKMGYYMIDDKSEEEMYIRRHIIEYIKSNVYSDIIKMSFSDIIEEITRNVDYVKFKNYLSARVTRSHELSIYTNDAKTYDFYSNLTLEELNYLGY